MRKATPKIFVSLNPTLANLLLATCRAVASNMLRKTTGIAWPIPKANSSSPPWKGVGALNMVNNIAGKTNAREQGPRAIDIITPNRNDPKT